MRVVWTGARAAPIPPRVAQVKKIVGSLVALMVMFGILLLPAVAQWRDDPRTAASAATGVEPEPTTITSYDATFDVSASGDLAVTERLAVSFPDYVSRHGIFRFWDRYDSSDPYVRRIVEDVEITLDGAAVPVERLREQGGRFDVAKIGSADVFVSPGVHTYVLRYRVPGVLEDGVDGSQSSFYWDLIPSGWAQDIEQARLVVNLPVPSGDVRCGIGLGSDPPPCDLSGVGTEKIVITAEGLADHTPVTVQVGLDVPTPEPGTRLPWTARFDPAFGSSVPILVLVALATLAAAAAGLWAGRRAREVAPAFPVLYAPPEGIGPAQGEYLLTEATTRTGYVASLLHAAERGAVELERNGKAWTIRDKSGADGWQGLDPVTLNVAHVLGGPGTSFTADPDSVSAGLRLKTETEAFEAGTKAWARDSGNLVDIPFGRMLAPLVLVGLLLPLVIAFLNPVNLTMVGMIPAAYGVFGLPLLRTGSSTRRTPQGRELWSRLGGFKRILSTPSATDRFDFSGREELYTAYIPWAVAFGCADEWADKFRTEMGYEPPTPSYFGYGYGAGSFNSSVSSLVSDFDSTLGSAISSYDATQSSSSSGGGGFSGGGGGGGGGGGSW